MPVLIYEHYMYPETKGTAVAVEAYSEIIKGNHQVVIEYELTLENGETLTKTNRPYAYIPMRNGTDEDERRVEELLKEVQIPGQPFEIWIDHKRHNWDSQPSETSTPYVYMIVLVVAILGLAWIIWPFFKS